MNQPVACQKFVDSMTENLRTNILLIEHRANLYELAAEREDQADCFLLMADKVKVLDFKQMIQIGLEKIEDINKYSDDITHRLTNQLIDLIRLGVRATNDELSLNITLNMKRSEAHMIRRRMVTQSSLFELFIQFMAKALSTNNALIKQKYRLYQLATHNPTRADYFLDKATEIIILDGEKLLNIGYETIKELDRRNAQELEYLTYRLEVLAITN